MGTGVFSEHRRRTGKVPGRDAVPPDSLCKEERREGEKIPQNLGLGLETRLSGRALASHTKVLTSTPRLTRR